MPFQNGDCREVLVQGLKPKFFLRGIMARLKPCRYYKAALIEFFFVKGEKLLFGKQKSEAFALRSEWL